MQLHPRHILFLILSALGIAFLAAAAYFALPDRPFAADDFEWLLNVRDLSLAAVASRAFDFGVESHFYRPLVWLLFWTEWRAFGLNAGGFHLVSLVLHLLNALLAGMLTLRMAHSASTPARTIGGALLTATIAALHPGPFEAVVWASAQSELLAATWLLLALHCWWSAELTRDRRAVGWVYSLAATIALALALLTKESAVVGLPLLALLEWVSARRAGRKPAYAALALPLLVTVAYLSAALGVATRNYLVRDDGYGIGPQLLLNPLRGIGLLVAPLPGVEDGAAPWLAPLGAIILALAFLFIWRRRAPKEHMLVGMLALAATLLPTAPFASPPDSRYLYPPVLVAAVLLGMLAASGKPEAESGVRGLRMRWGLSFVLAVLLVFFALFEVRGREARFAAGARPGEELRRLAVAQCAADQLNRMLIVDPPIAAPHAEAIVKLSCGKRPRPIILGQDDVERELRTNTLVVIFEGGVPVVALRTPPPS